MSLLTHLCILLVNCLRDSRQAVRASCTSPHISQRQLLFLFCFFSNMKYINIKLLFVSPHFLLGIIKSLKSLRLNPSTVILASPIKTRCIRHTSSCRCAYYACINQTDTHCEDHDTADL